MWKDARLLLLALTIFVVLNGVTAQKLRVGDAVNIFHNYGNLSESMRVVRLQDRETWIFREPTFRVYRNLVETSRRKQWGPHDLEADFSVKLCDNFDQLLGSYFSDFKFEGVANLWPAFLGSRSKSVIASSLGIEPSFIANGNSYILVRVIRFREEQKLARTSKPLILNEKVARAADSVNVEDDGSVLGFISSFGSHYIDSFVTGNSVYQVFVYDPKDCLPIKNLLTNYGRAGLPSEELSQYLSPQHAKHIGAIQTASGNRTVEAWATEKFWVATGLAKYTSLFTFGDHADRLQQLAELLGNEAILKLRLRNLKPFFNDPKRRKYFRDFINNTATLWNENM